MLLYKTELDICGMINGSRENDLPISRRLEALQNHAARSDRPRFALHSLNASPPQRTWTYADHSDVFYDVNYPTLSLFRLASVTDSESRVNVQLPIPNDPGHLDFRTHMAEGLLMFSHYSGIHECVQSMT